MGADPDSPESTRPGLYTPLRSWHFCHIHPLPSSTPPYHKVQPKRLGPRTGFRKQRARCALPLTCWVSFCNSVLLEPHLTHL